MYCAGLEHAAPENTRCVMHSLGLCANIAHFGSGMVECSSGSSEVMSEESGLISSWVLCDRLLSVVVEMILPVPLSLNLVKPRLFECMWGNGRLKVKLIL